MSPPPVILGVDPGFFGALAFYDPATELLAVHDIPLYDFRNSHGGKKKVIDLLQLAAIIDENVKDRRVIAYVETVGARPGEGPTSAFTFGFGAGVLHGMCAAHFLRIEGVTPGKWKRTMGLPPGATKDMSRAAASRLLPQYARLWPLKKHDGRAEAALIALYGAGQLQP